MADTNTEDVTNEDDLFKREREQKQHEAERLLVRKQQTRSLRGKTPSYNLLDTQIEPVTAVPSAAPKRLGRRHKPGVPIGRKSSEFHKTKARRTFADPITPEVDATTTGVKLPEVEETMAIKTLDFLFGSEAAVIGIAHDSDGWSWSMENLKQQWSEQPLWSSLLGLGSLVGTMVLPAGLAVRSSMKVGALAVKAGVRTKGGIKAFESFELDKWKKAGFIEKDVTSYAELGGRAGAKRARQAELTRDKYLRNMQRNKQAESGKLDWKDHPVDRLNYEFDKRFSNSYQAHVDPSSLPVQAKKEYHRALNSLWKTDTMGTLFKTMPVAASGPRISAYILGRLNPTLAGKATKDFGKLTAAEKAFGDFSVRLACSV